MSIGNTSKTNGTFSANRIRIREEFYGRHFGSIASSVAHSTDLASVHIDIYRCPPTKKRPYWVLVTGGMSDRPQTIPDPKERFIAPRAELFMYCTEPQRWMLNTLKILSEFPFRQATFLHWYHTYSTKAAIAPRPCEFESCLLLPPRFEKASINLFKLEGDKVDFLWMIPITKREREYAVKNGSERLESLLMAHRPDAIALLANEHRKSLA